MDALKEKKTIYECVVADLYNKETGLSSLYLYALYWVATVFTTVGYGSHTYGTSLEYGFACLLEALSIIVGAYLVVIVSGMLTLNQHSYRTLVDTRLN